MPVVNLSDGRKLNFPDSMSKEDIAEVLRNNPPPPISQPDQGMMVEETLEEAPERVQEPRVPAQQPVAPPNQPQNVAGLLQQIQADQGGAPQDQGILPPELQSAIKGMSTAAQSALNTPIKMANVIPGLNLPTADVASNIFPQIEQDQSLNELVGSMVGFGMPRAAIGAGVKGLSSIPKIDQIINKLRSAPPLVKGLGKYGGSGLEMGMFQAGEHPDEDQLTQFGQGATLGMGLRGIGDLIFKGIPAGLSKLGIGKAAGSELVGITKLIDEKKIQPKIEAARRLKTPLQISEAAESPYLAKKEKRFLTTPEAAIEREQLGKERLASEKGAVNRLLDSIYGKSVKNDEHINKLYTQAYRWNLKPEVVNKLMEDPLIEDAIKRVATDKAWQRKLKDIPENNYAYLDKVRKYLSDKEQRFKRQGEGGKANEYKQARRALVDVMDDSVPVYAEARAMAELKHTADDIRKSLKKEQVDGSEFYRKIIQNDFKYEDFLKHLRNNPEATQMIKDMKTAWNDLTKVETAGSAAFKEESNLKNIRNTYDVVIKAWDHLFNRKRNYKAVKFVRDMDRWSKELQKAKKTGDPNKVNQVVTDTLAKAGIMSAKETNEKEE